MPMKMEKKGRVVVRLAPEREGPLFVSVSSKAQAAELAREVMGLSDTARDLVAALEAIQADEVPAQVPAALVNAAVKP